MLYQEVSEIKMGGSDRDFPQVRKAEHVVPLHQGGDKTDLNKYWAIFKLSKLLIIRSHHTAMITMLTMS